MTMSLLTDRFKFRAHRITKQTDGYALLTSKGGFRIREAGTQAQPPVMPDDSRNISLPESYIAATIPEAGVIEIAARRASMSQLASTLERAIQTPVWDQTGVSGNFSFVFRFWHDLSAERENDAPALGTAMEEALGLRLEKRKGPVETLVIDSIGEPSEN